VVFGACASSGAAVQQAVSKLPPPSCLPFLLKPGMIVLFRLWAGMKSAQIILFCLLAPRLPYARA
jgi:hypothetical protein